MESPLSTSGLRCPSCHAAVPTTWSSDHMGMQHWFWNPAMAVPELLLGMSLPAEIHLCGRCKLQFQYSSYLYCPQCDTSHHGLIWGGWHALGHWGGLHCPECGGAIPRLQNFLTSLLLLVTFPLWWLPTWVVRPWWGRFEQQRARRAREHTLLQMQIRTHHPHQVVASRVQWTLTLVVMLAAAIISVVTKADPLALVASEVAILASGGIYARWGGRNASQSEEGG